MPAVAAKASAPVHFLIGTGRKGRDAEYLLRAAMNAKMNNGRWTAPDPARAYNTNMVKAFERRVRAQKKKLEFEGAVHSREVEHRLAREKSMKTKTTSNLLNVI